MPTIQFTLTFQSRTQLQSKQLKLSENNEEYWSRTVGHIVHLLNTLWNKGNSRSKPKKDTTNKDMLYTKIVVIYDGVYNKAHTMEIKMSKGS